MKKNVFAAMSGGVDSSVAAYLLIRAGYDVTGATMTLYRPEGQTGDTQDVTDARAICDKLGIPHKTYDMGEVFCRCVIEDFIKVYEEGGTPNPCVTCNKTIKFGALWDAVSTDGAEAIATGHYARIRQEGDRHLLCKAADESKDQSYFLWQLPRELLSRILFPLGQMTKPAIRALAAEQGFETAHKSDSQDICFVPNKDYATFIEDYTGRISEAGDFVDTEGKVLGRHKGIIHYTIGQRKGLGIALGAPAFVCAKDPVSRRVVLGTNEDLFSKEIKLTNVNLLAVDDISTPMQVTARVRSTHRGSPATVVMTGKDTALVTFDEPQRAACIGQSCVFYAGEVVVGGGIISTSMDLHI
ncbi:MAG: tRNA 2-thiouridine(34) synthase MnmA [Ruminococcaceae bacterium]|nr:tRNA 2-thiouridine(34) synthase MnmA [Oscillospiraceae bacterium]